MRYIAGSSNGRTHASGACYLGSSPSPAARLERSYMLGFLTWVFRTLELVGPLKYLKAVEQEIEETTANGKTNKCQKGA